MHRAAFGRRGPERASGATPLAISTTLSGIDAERVHDELPPVFAEHHDAIGARERTADRGLLPWRNRGVETVVPGAVEMEERLLAEEAAVWM